MINEGRVLSLAGDEKMLSQLPSGNWIAGSIPYFMDEEKGVFSQDKIYVNELNTYDDEFYITVYDENTIKNIVTDSFSNGYTILIIPAFQKVHQEYSINAENIDGLFDNAITGWVSGMDLNSDSVPKTYNGVLDVEYPDKAVAIHVKLPENKFAQIEIVNIFEQNKNNDIIEFLDDSFDVVQCRINGKITLLTAYIEENEIDTQLPLIADYSGALINVCIKEVNFERGVVSFYGPVFKGKKYLFSEDIPSYIDKFQEATEDISTDETEFSCNCILNYLYGGLEDKKINNTKGPITFGEIAYNLLNQTLVLLTIEDV